MINSTSHDYDTHTPRSQTPCTLGIHNVLTDTARNSFMWTIFTIWPPVILIFLECTIHYPHLSPSFLPSSFCHSVLQKCLYCKARSTRSYLCGKCNVTSARQCMIEQTGFPTKLNNVRRVWQGSNFQLHLSSFHAKNVLHIHRLSIHSLSFVHYLWFWSGKSLPKLMSYFISGIFSRYQQFRTIQSEKFEICLYGTHEHCAIHKSACSMRETVNNVIRLHEDIHGQTYDLGYRQGLQSTSLTSYKHITNQLTFL